jgi:hypothetical protein
MSEPVRIRDDGDTGFSKLPFKLLALNRCRSRP